MFILWLLIGQQVYKLPTACIYATYFGGDEKAGLSPDTEARDIWLKFLPPGRVFYEFSLFFFQGTDASHLKEAMDVAESFASMKLR